MILQIPAIMPGMEDYKMGQTERYIIEDEAGGVLLPLVPRVELLISCCCMLAAGGGHGFSYCYRSAARRKDQAS